MRSAGKKKRTWTAKAAGVGITAALVLMPVGAQVQGPSGFELPWVTIDGGGGHSASARYDMHATVGQPEASATPLSSARFDLLGGFWYSRPSETVCPDGPDNLFKVYGRIIEGDTTLLCDSDDARIQIVNILPVTPLLPFVRFEIWAHTSFAGAGAASVDYLVEGYCTAVVGGGQNGDTLRTRIKNYATGVFELVDVRPTNAFTDEFITHTQTANAPDYVQAGDGEVRVRMDAFDPGTAVNAGWEVRVDVFEVTVNR